MKHLLKKILVTILICIPVAEVLISPMLLKAANTSDPAITDFIIYPTNPAPNTGVDFLVTLSNYGDVPSIDVILVVNYEQFAFTKILLGDARRCIDTGASVNCTFNNIDPNAEDSIGFTAIVKDTAKTGEEVVSFATIDEVTNPADVKENDFKKVTIKIGSNANANPGAGGTTSASEILKDQKILDEPSVKQNVSMIDVQNNPDWETSGLFTAGLKFMIRGKEALAWALGIKDSGFHNPAIQENYLKVLTVVNSLFIIGLLAIAGMWMFSILIPRRYLRQVIFVYGIAVIFVNFALPLNQLLIDGTGLLQKTFMSGVNITNIVESPNYNDKTAIGYQNNSGLVTNTESKKLDFSIVDQDKESVASNVTIGKIQQDFLNPSYTGTINTKDGDETLQLRSTGTDVNLTLNKDQSFQIAGQKVFNPDLENSAFAFLMLAFTGLAYFGMALVFILRIVILWGLMIISPVLFLLGIFRVTRSYFMNWLGVYAKWLLVGPFMALGIAIVVSIWKTTGLPITSAYTGFGDFGVLSNVGFYLPGSSTVNTLSNTQQMMEYMLFLVMLYLPIIFAFMLTRQKFWSSAGTMVTEKRGSARASKTAQTTVTTETNKKEQTALSQAKSVVSGVTGFFGSQLSKFTKASMPDNLKNVPAGQPRTLESATSFLPQHLALTSVHDMLDLTAGGAKGSRKSREKAIEYLAAPEAITDKTEHQKVMAVRQEINKRVQAGDTEAIRVMDEIHEREKLHNDQFPITNSQLPIPNESPNIPAISGQLSRDENKDLSKKEKPEETSVHNELIEEEDDEIKKMESEEKRSEKDELTTERNSRHK